MLIANGDYADNFGRFEPILQKLSVLVLTETMVVAWLGALLTRFLKGHYRSTKDS